MGLVEFLDQHKDYYSKEDSSQLLCYSYKFNTKSLWTKLETYYDSKAVAELGQRLRLIEVHEEQASRPEDSILVVTSIRRIGNSREVDLKRTITVWERADKRFTRGSRGLGWNPGQDMDVCTCTVSSPHWGTLNSCRAASPLVRLVKGKKRWEASHHPQGVLPLNWGETELNRTVTCMVLKAKQVSLSHLPL
ncbi:uncharacterized protein TNCV_152071 [Trichonephila clavipes]|uniref:Uncharacterized protein n=1 Tax=Trichonephila clavipes TaxID=2585209 RepID=A0A8X6RDW8_TRICX|nr:uncharacterized protein TNCV_152071 [Trichonephila clavipes]